VSNAGKVADAEKVREFLEKFVTVKFGLFLDPANIAEFVKQSFEEVSTSYLAHDPRMMAKSNQVIASLTAIYKSAEFHNYRAAVGDIRKLKRLINTLLVLEIEKTDFEHNDFDGDDLLHLLLIYVNYPGTFRKIYDAETNGSTGFFSVIKNAGVSGKNNYENSNYFKEFCGLLNDSPSQQFLLGKIFDLTKRQQNFTIGHDEETDLKTRACFNGGFYGCSRNLEQYLKLIVRLAKPTREKSYRFYLKQLDLLLNGEKIESIFEQPEFSIANEYASRTQLLRVIINSNKLTPSVGKLLIQYILAHIHHQSALNSLQIDINKRDDFTYFLIRILNNHGWSDGNGIAQDNSATNVHQITHWIFGNLQSDGPGILFTLASPERGALGWYDLMLFRLYCCASRGSDFFNLQRAMVKRADPDADALGLVSKYEVIQMRQISQQIFCLFKEQFVDAKRNWFAQVDELTMEDLGGIYVSNFQDAIHRSVISGDDLESAIRVTKTGIKTFVIYQLANSVQTGGIGCGYYDPTGSIDSHEIANQLNDYLFNFCFDPKVSPENAEHFVDFLLANFTRNLWNDSVDKDHFTPIASEFTKFLQQDKLFQFWRANSAEIKGMALEKSNKSVYTSGFVGSYHNHLPKLYRALDEMKLEN
jgi:hypothetical protein